MEDLFKKFLYTGVGLVSVTADKIQKSMDKLVDENKISSEEGKKVVDDLIKDTEGKKEEFEGQLKKVVEDFLNRFKLASYSEVEDLQKRVEALEAQVGTETATAPKRKAAPKKKEAVA